MIARAVSGRVVDELAVRLAGATELAIDEIVRLRGDAIKAGRRGRCGCGIPTRRRSDVARLHRLPAQHGCRRIGGARLGAARRLPGRRHGHRDRRGPGRHGRARLRAGRARPGRRGGLRPRPRRARRPRGRRARRAGARCRRRASSASAAPSWPTASRSTRAIARSPRISTAELGALVVKRTARRRARTLLGREIPFGVGVAIGAGANFSVDAPHGPHGAALLRIHRERARARA